MLKWPQMLMIGAANRNVGKTELACRLIERLAGEGSVYGVKITVIRDESGGCPRGGEGCGVCTSLFEPYEITSESQRDTGKDTSRMLAAGADEVLWLRVHIAELEKGVAALRERVPANVPVICESNTARNAIEPGLFLIINKAGEEPEKEHCVKLSPLSDRQLFFHGDGWDVEPDQLFFDGKTWQLKERACGIILAGGKSKRFGTDKALVDIDGKPMIEIIARKLKEIFPQVLVSTNNSGAYDFLELDCVPDRETGCGPLMGIVSCLEKSDFDLNFVTACDIPYSDARLIRRMLCLADGYDAVIPSSGEGLYEPLFAVYRKAVIRPALDILERGGRRIVELFEHSKVSILTDEDTTLLKNINTREDYDILLKGCPLVGDRPFCENREEQA